MTKFSEWTYAVYDETIIENPFIDFELYPKQEFVALTSCQDHEGVNEFLTGGPGGGGKTMLLAALALQFVEFSHYRCLVTRKNYRELIGTGSVFDIIKNIPGAKSRESGLIRVIFPSGAEIHFKAFNDESHKQDVKGESYHTILNDEASELPESVLRFLYRSLRKKIDDWIPLRFGNASNPGGESTDYLVEKYIDGDLPYIEMGYRDNPYIDDAVYEESLNNLDYIDQQYQMYGNWHYRPAAGDLINRDELQDSYLVDTYLQDNKVYPHMSAIAVDLAGTGRDRFVATHLILLQNGLIIREDSISISDSYPEDRLYNFVEEKCIKYHTQFLDFEREPGGDSIYSKRYWQEIMGPLTNTYGLIVSDVRPFASKYNRARPVAKAIRDGRLKLLRHLETDTMKDGLFDQFINVSPNLDDMKKMKSPDELDSLGYAFDYLNRFTHNTGLVG